MEIFALKSDSEHSEDFWSGIPARLRDEVRPHVDDAVVLTAIENGALISRVIAVPEREAGQWRLAWFEVSPHPARPVLAKSLLSEMEDRLAAASAESVVVLFTPGVEFSEELQGWLSARDWTGPEVHWVIFTSSAERFLQAPLIKARPLPASLTVTTWADLDEAQNEALDARDIPPKLHPVRYRNRIDASMSLALLKQKEVVGFLLIERPDELSIHFASAWIDPDHASPRCLWNLVRQAVLDAQEKGIVRGVQSIPALDFPEAAELARRQQQPYAESFTEILGMMRVFS